LGCPHENTPRKVCFLGGASYNYLILNNISGLVEFTYYSSSRALPKLKDYE
jgi:hypothetical protein